MERYPMCKDQPAQIDCRVISCSYHTAGGCSNISPAITLSSEGTFTCWSKEDTWKQTPILIKPKITGTVFDRNGKEIKTVKASKVVSYEGGFKAEFDPPLEGRFFKVRMTH